MEQKETPQYSAKSYLDQKWALGETIHKFFCHSTLLRQAKISFELTSFFASEFRLLCPGYEVVSTHVTEKLAQYGVTETLAQYGEVF